MSTKQGIRVSRSATIGALAVAALASGCTFHHSVPIRYTPLIQTRRLADAAAPQVVTVGEFVDARSVQRIGKERLNPISVHKLEFETVGDVPKTVRDAFLDGFLKSGFNVPVAGDASAAPFLSVAGKVLTYTVDTKTGWNNVSMTADVAVAITLTNRAGEATELTVRGRNTAEGKSLGYDATMAETLDRALQDCVKHFLEDPQFLALAAPAKAHAAAQ